MFLGVKVEHLPMIAFYNLQLGQTKLSDVPVMPKRDCLMHHILDHCCFLVVLFRPREKMLLKINVSDWRRIVQNICTDEKFKMLFGQQI